MASLESTLKTTYHQAMALATCAQTALAELETLKAQKNASAPIASTSVEAAKPTKAKKAAPTPAPVANASGTRVLAGFTITPPAKGERMNLPSKEEIARKALSMGVDQGTIDTFFPAGVKPTNEAKLKVLEQLDARAKVAA